MTPISFREVIQKAVATPHTVAAKLGLMALESVFSPILACQFDQFCLDSRKIGVDDGFVLLKSSRQDAQTNLN
ncbi:UDP-N-acetylmuramoylalanyl-D-glutamate--2,6-diaminopimelate ligase, partial [Moraxella catarrhalis]|nr:UDP-N-acetylmuramoylalanyl-D-glutamate--2,6-diaminopimelate ligase [Moraxella catarrhalis]